MTQKNTDSFMENTQFEDKTENDQKETKKYILDCRATGRGARTWVVFPPVNRFDISRSGNHWKECVFLKENEKVYIKDISNSLKHNCYILTYINGRIEKTYGKKECGHCIVCEFENTINKNKGE